MAAKTTKKAPAGKAATEKAAAEKGGMGRFKSEVASELGVSLKDGYNGDITAREAGSIGGEMVRRMVKKQKDSMK